jgi:hypothetical protein
MVLNLGLWKRHLLGRVWIRTFCYLSTNRWHINSISIEPTALRIRSHWGRRHVSISNPGFTTESTCLRWRHHHRSYRAHRRLSPTGSVSASRCWHTGVLMRWHCWGLGEEGRSSGGHWRIHGLSTAPRADSRRCSCAPTTRVRVRIVAVPIVATGLITVVRILLLMTSFLFLSDRSQ